MSSIDSANGMVNAGDIVIMVTDGSNIESAIVYNDSTKVKFGREYTLNGFLALLQREGKEIMKIKEYVTDEDYIEITLNELREIIEGRK